MFNPLEQFEAILLMVTSDRYLFSIIFFYFYLVFFIAAFFFNSSFFNITFLLNNWQRFFCFYLNFFIDLFKQQIYKNYRNAFFVLIFCLFSHILFSNLLGFSFYGFTLTSHISITFTYSTIFFWGIVFLGFWKHGLHFIDLLKPSDVPKQLFHFLFFIELLSYLSRVFSLAIRLFANMMAGHTLLYIVGIFFYFLLKKYNLFFLIPSFFVALGIFCIIVLEFAVAFLQAYVFTVLVCIYLNDALEGKH